MKVSDLTGVQLDYWVARAEGMPKGRFNYVAYSSRWEVGGPIIQREGIWLSDDGEEEVGPWIASCKPHANKAIYEGKTPLEAAMRCFVASKFGEEVPDADKA